MYGLGVARFHLPQRRDYFERRGPCVDVHVSVMYPRTKAEAKVPKEICSECPVREECLEHALDNNEEYGVWGGTTELERRALKKARQAA